MAEHGIPHPLKNAAKLLEQALRVTLDAKDPARRLERREEKKAARMQGAREPAAAQPRPDDVRAPPHLRPATATSRSPSATGPSPALSHNHAEDNLEALCAAHSALRAREYFGSERIEKAIATRRQATSSRTMLRTKEHRLDDV